jgi:hypothetical protein
MGTRSTWLALALGIALPRWTYLLAGVYDDERWSTMRWCAWLVDVVCLTVAALALRRLQHKHGDDDSRNVTYIACAGFTGDVVTTFLAPWWKAPSLLVIAAMMAWTFGTSSWLSRRCHESGAPYFLYRLFVGCVAVSSLLAFLRPEWPSFPSTLVIDTGMAVQCLFVARALKSSISPP